MSSNKSRPVKVGFDLDGVLLYNPLNAVRPLFKLIGQKVFKKENAGSFIPKTRFETFSNAIYIKSSIFTSPGVKHVHTLAEAKVIQAYIITARHSKLKDVYEKSISKLNHAGHFHGCYYNSEDLEPFEFKKKMIDDLALDVYIDDNWDVVQKLNETTNVLVYWVSNFIDKKIDYKHKYSDLSKALAQLEELEI